LGNNAVNHRLKKYRYSPDKTSLIPVLHMEYFKIGKFVAAHGLTGELVLKHDLGKKTLLKGLDVLFIEDKKNSFLPWFIQGTRIKANGEVFVKLESVDSREAATRLVQKEVWFPEKDLKKFSAKSAPINLLGYTLINDGTALGQVEEVIEQAHQMLCRLSIKQKEVLIPLNEDTLQKIDHTKKEIRVQLPDGLLAVYLD
jgi:16S rRNA processing protein RimM